MDLDSVSLVNPVDFGGGVTTRWLTAADFELAFEPDSGMVMALHRRTRRMRLIHVASGIALEPTADSLPVALKPKDPPPAKPLGANGRGTVPRPAR